MRMVINPTGMIARGLRLARLLCTSAEAAPLAVARSKRLYQRLSALGSIDSTVSDTLDEYTKEGKQLTKMALVSCLKELRKYGKFDHSLQILKWMESRKMKKDGELIVKTHELVLVLATLAPLLIFLFGSSRVGSNRLT